MKSWIKGGLIGGGMGIIVWLFDYDLLLNVGGPNTPISDYIRIFFAKLFGIYQVADSNGLLQPQPFNSLFPLVILIISLFVLGAIIGFLVGKFKNRNQNS